MYEDDAPIQDKIESVAKNVYGASGVYLYPAAEEKIQQFTKQGLGHFPVCMAKTHLSLSSDPTLLNVPENFTLPVRDIRAYTGAGWLVPLCGDISRCPASAGRRPRTTSTSTRTAARSASSRGRPSPASANGLVPGADRRHTFHLRVRARAAA